MATLAHAETISTRVALDARPDQPLDLADLTITITFHTLDSDAPTRSDTAGIECRQWIERYLDQRDASRIFDFAPTSRNLALYLLRVFCQLSSEVTAVTVTLDGRTSDTATLG